MRVWTLLTCCALFRTCAHAQTPPDIQWQGCFGGSDADWATAIELTNDGGFITIGYALSDDGDVTYNHGENDFWVMKFDAARTLQWQKSYGGAGTDWANDIEQADDGGYFMVGSSNSVDGDVTGAHGDLDIWVVRVDQEGALLWQRALGGSDQDRGMSILPTDDGGCIVAGETFSNNGNVSGNHGLYDAWVIKLDASGNVQWQNTLGGSGYDMARCIASTADGGSVIAGLTGSSNGDVSANNGGLYDVWVVELDASGGLVWERAIGGSDWDSAESIVLDDDNGFVIAGVTASTDGDVAPGAHGGDDFWIVKLSATGDILWQHVLGGGAPDKAKCIHRTADGGFVATGQTASTDGDVVGNHGATDAWVVRLNGQGGLVWTRALGGSVSDHGYAICGTADGGCLIGGRTGSTDQDVSGNHGSDDFWLVELAGGDVFVPVLPDEPTVRISFNALDRTALLQSSTFLGDADILLTDALGRTIKQERVASTEHRMLLGDVPGGCYVLTLTTRTSVWSQRGIID